MDKTVELKRRLRDIVGAKPNLPITGIVQSVEQDHCTVELKGGFVVSDVKLKATISEGDNYIKLIPKVGSAVVMISFTEDKNNLAIVKIDEIEQVDYKQDGLEVFIDSTDGKVSVKNNQVSLIDVFSDLATLLKQFKVKTPAGPSEGLLPDTLAAIIQLETTFNKLLK